MGLLRWGDKITGENSNNRSGWFQLIWLALHSLAAILHIGSAIYHLRRVKNVERRCKRCGIKI